MRKKVLKNIMAMLLTVAMLISLFPSCVFAADESINTSDYGLASNNILVQVLDNAVAVLSHPDNSSYYISSVGVTSSLSSSQGYSISYVDADKNEATDTVATVTDGYIKLTKDDADDVYIPIVAQGASLMDKFSTPDSSVDISYSLTGGLGGKSEDDTAHMFTTGEAGVTIGTSFGFSNLSATGNTRPFTIEFNVYTEGDAQVSLNVGDEQIGTTNFLKCQLCHFAGDGKLYYLASDKNDYGATGGLVAAGEANTSYSNGYWKHVAIVYDGLSANDDNPAYVKDYESKTSGRSRYRLYIDGKLASEARKNTGYATQIPYFNFNVTGGSAGAKVAIDDIKAYYGYYDYANAVVAPENTSFLTFDTDTKTVRCVAGAAVDEVIADAKEATGGAYAQVFTDLTLTTPATKLTNGNVLVVTSPGGAYDYYTLNTVLTAGITSNNLLVQVLDDAIAVFSHPNNSSYYISSIGLTNSLSSSLGYSISYVDANKDDVTSTIATVTDGYIRLTKDGTDDLYIPVITKGSSLMHKLTNLPGSTSEANFSYTGLIGGKASDDPAYVFNAKEGGITAGASFGFENLTSTGNTRPFTIEFNVYVEGDAEAMVTFGKNIGENKFENYQLYHFANDGKLYYNAENYGYSAGLEGNSPSVPYTKGQWKRVAVTYDSFSGQAYIKDGTSKTSGRNRYTVYVDGIANDARMSGSYDADLQKLYLCVTGGSAGSKVAFADFDAYYGYYYPSSLLSFGVTGSNDDIMTADTSIYYNSETIKSFDDLENHFNTNADIFTYFRDSSLSQEATSISEAAAMVIYSTDSKTYAYYKVAPMGVSVDSVEFKADTDGKIYAEVKVSCIGNTPQNATVVMVLCDADGAIHALTSSATQSVSTTTTIATSALDTTNLTPKAFVISDWSNRVAITEMYQTE